MSDNNNNPVPSPPSTGEQILLRLLIKNTDNLERIIKIMEQQIIYTNLLLFPNGNDPRVTTEQQLQEESNNKEHKEGNKESGSNIQVINSKPITKKD